MEKIENINNLIKKNELSNKTYFTKRDNNFLLHWILIKVKWNKCFKFLFIENFTNQISIDLNSCIF